MRWIALILLVPVVAAAAPVPDDARLEADRATLQSIVDQAEHDGLPSELLIAKVREGLVKQVPPARIVAAVRALDAGLEHARKEALAHLAKPSPGLLKAIVEVHALGIGEAEVHKVLAAAAPRELAQKALEVLGDLLQRGYPPGLSTRVVVDVITRRATQLDRLVPQAEALLRVSGVSRADALEAIDRAAAQGLTLDQSGSLVHGHEGAEDSLRGPPRDTSGNRAPNASSGHGSNGNGHGKP